MPAVIDVSSPYPYDEYVQVLKGEVTLTNLQGNAKTFQVGDSFNVPKGWMGTWAMPQKFREMIVIEARAWQAHDIARPKRGMYDKWLFRDLDQDGDLDVLGTRGNSEPYDGVIWLEQIRSRQPLQTFTPARIIDSQQLALPSKERYQSWRWSRRRND